MEWTILDNGTLVLYFFLIVLISFWVSSRKGGASNGSKTNEYFLADRSMKWWAVAASLFASNIGAEHFVGLAGEAAFSGIAVAWYEWGAVLSLLVLGRFFLPVYLKSGVSTMPEWVERRYSSSCRTFLVTLSLMLYVFTKLSSSLYAGQIILFEIFGIGRLAAAVVLILGTMVYTMAGGLTAVMYTEVLQTVVLITGSSVLMVATLLKVGGLEGLEHRITDPHYFHIFRPASDPTFPWPGMLTGYYVVAMWYWTADQVIVQRALAARNIIQGQAGCVAAAFLKLLPGFLMVLPGMAARILMPHTGDPTEAGRKAEYDRAYPWLIMNVMPHHLRGLVVSAMLSALMSSFASVFNSSATLISLDVYRKVYPSASTKTLVWVGRLSVVVMSVLSLLWLPVIPLLGSQLFIYLQKPPALIAPPIMAIFLWGMVTNKVNKKGAIWTLTIGVFAGLTKFFLEIAFHSTTRQIPLLTAVVALPFLYFAIISFVICSLILISVSMALPEEQGKSHPESQNLMWRREMYEELLDEAVLQETANGNFASPTDLSKRKPTVSLPEGSDSDSSPQQFWSIYISPLPRERSSGGAGASQGWELLPVGSQTGQTAAKPSELQEDCSKMPGDVVLVGRLAQEKAYCVWTLRISTFVVVFAWLLTIISFW